MGAVEAQVSKSEKQMLYSKAWKAKNQRQYNLALSKTADADVIAVLDEQQNKAQFIKEAIRAHLGEESLREDVETLRGFIRRYEILLDDVLAGCGPVEGSEGWWKRYQDLYQETTGAGIYDE